MRGSVQMPGQSKSEFLFFNWIQVQAKARFLIGPVDQDGNYRAVAFIEEGVEHFCKQRFDSARAFGKFGIHLDGPVKVNLLIQQVIGSMHARIGARNLEN